MLKSKCNLLGKEKGHHRKDGGKWYDSAESGTYFSCQLAVESDENGSVLEFSPSHEIKESIGRAGC
jgi:hypothetical protein